MPPGGEGERAVQAARQLKPAMETVEMPPQRIAGDSDCENYRNEYLLTGLDGACRNQQFVDLRRGGYGVYYGNNHSHNKSGKVIGYDQGAFRGELTALVYAVCWAWCLSELLIDNQVQQVAERPSRSLVPRQGWV